MAQPDMLRHAKQKRHRVGPYRVESIRLRQQAAAAQVGLMTCAASRYVGALIRHSQQKFKTYSDAISKNTRIASVT